MGYWKKGRSLAKGSGRRNRSKIITGYSETSSKLSMTNSVLHYAVPHYLLPTLYGRDPLRKRAQKEIKWKGNLVVRVGKKGDDNALSLTTLLQCKYSPIRQKGSESNKMKGKNPASRGRREWE